jgi:hypothetical protein
MIFHRYTFLEKISSRRTSYHKRDMILIGNEGSKGKNAGNGQFNVSFLSYPRNHGLKSV